MRDADATAVTTVVAARTSELEIAAIAASITRDGNAALGTLVTASSGACICVLRRLFPSAFFGFELLEYVLKRSVVVVQHDHRLGA